MHVFGYGSLLWKQGFPYEKMIPGYIKGFMRRFWQGSEDHRGEPGRPGRVVSIFRSEDPEERVMGVAFHIHKDDEESVRSLLVERETGYDIVKTLFYPNDQSASSKPVELEVFVANKNIKTYLGPASEKDIAWQIYHAKGMSGSNTEYMMRVVLNHRKIFPGDRDGHLDKLEQELLEIAKQKGETLQDYSGS